MQFLESSVVGLRAACHRLTSADHAAQVTLFPMVHVAEASFYERVARDALDHDVVLVEGVRARSARRLARAYSWAPLRRLGLVQQPPIAPREGPPAVIRAVLSGPAFEALWRELPLWLRVAAPAATQAYGLWLRLTARRATLIRRQSQDDLADRDTLLLPGTMAAKPLEVIMQARDAHLREVLGAQLRRARTSPVRIAVIYGAAHMPAVLAELRSHGDFRPAESAWLTAIGL